MADPDGFEPPTTDFEDQASIQLMLRAVKFVKKSKPISITK